ncbi:MAG: nitroreductase [Gemmatimonadales bacterium]|nr:MAG: nitroreductase [Gemmatimonadales bacterium]
MKWEPSGGSGVSITMTIQSQHPTDTNPDRPGVSPAVMPPHPTPSEFELVPEIQNRWSPRAFSSRPVPRDLTRRLLEAARWAPSSFNEQPWRFLVGDSESPAFRETLRDLLMDGNAWARRAPVLMLSAWRSRLTKNDKANRVALRDLGAAEENLFLQAVSQGLVAHQMGGFSVPAAEALLREQGLGPEFEVGVMTAIGFPGDLDDLDGSLRERELKPRKRKPLSEIALFGGAGDDEV